MVLSALTLLMPLTLTAPGAEPAAYAAAAWAEPVVCVAAAWAEPVVCAVASAAWVARAAQGTEAPPSTAYARICAQRNLPLAEPERLARHYRMVGTATFHMPQGDPVVQEFQLALAGAARQRYSLHADTRKNVFLLAGPGQAWLKQADAELKPYAAEELQRDAWARWLVLRFPWDHAPMLQGSELPTAALRMPAPGGWNAHLECDADGLPRTLTLTGLPEQGEDGTEFTPKESLEVGDWRSVLDGGPHYPHRWIWTKSWGRLLEEVSLMEVHVLYYAEAFQPRTGPPPKHQVLRPNPTRGPENTEETIGLKVRSIAWIPAEIWELTRQTPPPGSEWLLLAADGGRRRAFVPDGGAAALPDWVIPTLIEQQTVLAWSGWRVLDLDQAAQQLRGAAAQTDREISGPLWVRVFDRPYEVLPFELLLPLVAD